MPSLYRQNTYNYKERGGNRHCNVNFRQKNGHHVRFSAFLQTFDTFQIFKGFCMTVQILFSARRTFTFYTVSQVNASLQQHAKRRFRIAKKLLLTFSGKKGPRRTFVPLATEPSPTCPLLLFPAFRGLSPLPVWLAWGQIPPHRTREGQRQCPDLPF